MKNNSLFILLAMLVVLLASCKKSDSTGGDTPAKKLKYISRSTSVQSSGTVNNAYTYDDKKRISTIKTTNSANAGAATTTTYAYNGTDLFEVELYQPAVGFRDVTEFSYANDKTVATARNRIYRNNNLDADKTYSYYYTNGKITQIKHDIYTDTYTYDSRGNVASRYSDEFKITSEWTYDDKLNPFTNGFPKKYLINSTVFYISPNNQLTRPPGPAITYVYDADGYPVSSTSGGATTTYVYVEM